MNTTAPDWFLRARSSVSPEDIATAANDELLDRHPGVFRDLDVPNPVRLYGVDTGFFYMPLSLWSFCSDRDDRFLLDLATTIAIGHGHFAIMDRVIDERVVQPPLIPAAQIMLSTYLARMCHAFGDVLDVHASHEHFYGSYAIAAVDEHRDRCTLRQVTTADIAALGLKSAPACVPLTAILTRWQRDDIVPAAVDAFLRFAGCLQLLDDLADIRVDFRDGLSSIPLNFLFVHALSLPEWPEHDALADDLLALMVHTRAREACLVLARDELTTVLDRTARIGLEPLHQAATARRRAIDDKLRLCRSDASPVV